MKERLIQIGYGILIFLMMGACVYFPYTWIYDKAVFDTLKKIECITQLEGGDEKQK